jgi:hypothetical protein
MAAESVVTMTMVNQKALEADKEKVLPQYEKPYKDAQGLYNGIIEGLKNLRARIKQAGRAYADECARKAAEEQRRLNEIAERERREAEAKAAEERRKAEEIRRKAEAEAEAARQAGDAAKAAEIAAKAEKEAGKADAKADKVEAKAANTVAPVAMSAAPSFGRTMSTSVNWTGEITDADLLRVHCIDTIAKLAIELGRDAAVSCPEAQLLEATLPRLKKHAKAACIAKQWPGARTFKSFK